MTLAHRLQDIERRLGGRQRRPTEMSTYELWERIVIDARDVPDEDLQRALDLLRDVEAGVNVSRDWSDEVLRILGPHVPELAAELARMVNAEIRAPRATVERVRQ